MLLPRVIPHFPFGAPFNVAIFKPGVDENGEPIERNRTFAATVQYRRSDARTGEASSYPVTSRTDERIAWGWLQRVEAEMTEVATTAGIPHGDLYGESLQKREFLYAAYNTATDAGIHDFLGQLLRSK